MTDSLLLALALTALFTVTAGYYLSQAIAQWAEGPKPGQDRVGVLAHLLMSLAMIGMAWGWGGPVARWFQIGVFGVLGLAFLARLARPGTVPGCHEGRLATSYHGLAMLGMTWMVAAMPLLGHAHGGSGGGGHDHGGGSGADVVAQAAPAQPWAVAVTAALAVVFAACALGWALARARGPAERREFAAVGAPDTPIRSPAPGTETAGTDSVGTVGDGAVAVADLPAGTGAPGIEARWCHVLMSLGMAGMLLLMV